MMEFFDVLYKRYSVRSYMDQPLPDGCITELIRAAVSAPSAHNAQPWHFAVCESDIAKLRLVQHTSAPFRQMLCTRLQPDEIEERLVKSFNYFMNIPALIVAFATQPWAKNPRDTEWTLALQSVSAAVTQLLLAAQAKGLGACWYSLPLYCAQEVRQAVQAPPDWEPVALVTVGYADDGGVKRDKRALDDMYTIL